MTRSQLKSYVFSLFREKNISEKQFWNACNILNVFKETEPFFYYFNMGKLYSFFGNCDDAIYYLNEAVKIDDSKASPYYNLFKCYIKVGSFDKGIEAFDNFLAKNKVDVNFEFVASSLYRLELLKNDFSSYLTTSNIVEINSNCGFNDLSDNEQLLNLYKSVIDAFNEKEYNICLEKLELMKSRIFEVNYPMEVDTLISLTNELKEKEAVAYMNMLADDSILLSDNQYCDAQLKILKANKYSQEAFLRMIESKIANGNTNLGKLLLQNIETMPRFQRYQDMIEYLNGCIREKEAFLLGLTSAEQEEFETVRKKAKKLYKKKANDDSLAEYCSAKELFGLPICDYYIGKIFFRQGKFNQARDMFLSYLKQGGFKAEKALMFLGQIERIQKNNSRSKQYLKRMQKIHTVFAREYFYDYYRYKKKKEKPSQDVDGDDFVKRKNVNLISMSISDFDLKPLESVEDFYDVGIDGKLSIIRGLLRDGNDKVANKLLEEVQRECEPADRGKVNQFVKNKKIFKNQNRTS